jgi:hypothetical protein
MDSAKSHGFLTPDAFAVSPDTGKVSTGSPDFGREELEAVFNDWWADNYSALSMGGIGDVFHLRLRLNAAFAKACSSSRVTPSAV